MANETKNNFNKKVQMYLACSVDDHRPETQCIFFNNGFAYATGTHILVRNRISEISGLNESEIEALNGKFLRADFYKDMLKYDSIMQRTVLSVLKAMTRRSSTSLHLRSIPTRRKSYKMP